MCVVIFRITLAIARQLHNQMLARVTRAPSSFFDSHPLGRILNRFSKDTAILDTQLPYLYLLYFMYIGIVFVSLVLTIYVLPCMAIFLVTLAIIMFRVKRRSAALSN